MERVDVLDFRKLEVLILDEAVDSWIWDSRSS